MTDKQTPTAEPIVAPSEAVVVKVRPYFPPTFVPDAATIIEGEWAGQPNYGCSLCGFAHLDRTTAEAHLPIHGKTQTGARP